MSTRRTLWCACAFACAALASTSVHAQSQRSLEAVPTATTPAFVVRPDDVSAARPVAVYLHGLCGGPARGCGYFRRAVGARSWLLCPSAPRRCGGGASWQGPLRARVAAVQRVVDAAAARSPGAIDRGAPGVLIGFSQGAYEAWWQARSRPGRWRGAAFIGAYVHLRRAELEAAGLRRVVLAAGRRDGSRATLAATAERLRAEGFPVRFVDLGAAGHDYVSGAGGDGWRDALAWLAGEG
jgi:acetyl esterase/lipase